MGGKQSRQAKVSQGEAKSETTGEVKGEAKGEHSKRAAIKIQSLFRGYSARRRFAIKPLEEKEASISGAFCTGNDPDNLLVPAQLKSDKPFALVGTSGARSLDIALSFCAENTTFIPKIYIVDRSINVKAFWSILQRCFAKAADLEAVKANIILSQDNFAKVITCCPCHSLPALVTLLAGLEQGFSFDRLKAMVMNVSMILGDWADPILFTKLKNICDASGFEAVYAYSSNIVSCSDFGDFAEEKCVAAILNNIKTLNPKASVYSNRDKDKRRPTKIFCYQGPGSVGQLKQDIGERPADLSLGFLAGLGLVAVYITDISGVESASESKRLPVEEVSTCQNGLFSKAAEKKARIHYACQQSRLFGEKFRAKRYQQALPFAEAAYKAYESVCDKGNPKEELQLAAALHNLGAVYQELGHVDQALELLARALVIRDKYNHAGCSSTRRRLKAVIDVRGVADHMKEPEVRTFAA